MSDMVLKPCCKWIEMVLLLHLHPGFQTGAGSKVGQEWGALEPTGRQPGFEGFNHGEKLGLPLEHRKTGAQMGPNPWLIYG